MVIGRLRNFFGPEHAEPEAAEPPRRRRRLRVAEPHPVVYAVGDVHGCLRQLQDAEAMIAEDPVPEHLPKLVVHLGDYVDRGPDSAGVLEYLTRRPPDGLERICLCGNHDDVMAGFMRDPLSHGSWLAIGGAETLRSYGLDPAAVARLRRREAMVEALEAAVPDHHVRFLEDLPVLLQVGDVVYVHAGLDPSRSLEDQSDADLMWIREPFLSAGPGIPVTVVHGHTPAADITTGPGRIGIDTAACATGKLSVLKVHGGSFTLL